MEELIKELIIKLGEDPEREGLKFTPYRAAKSLKYLTEGYEMDVEKIVNDAIYHEKCDEIVVVKHIHFYSLCEHHLLPFYGVCHVGYLPDGKIIGLSKIPRIVDVFARRMQLQERMTYQIAECIEKILKPRGVAVVTEAYHMCIMMRGVQKQDARTMASTMLGAFRERSQTRSEFLSLINMNPI